MSSVEGRVAPNRLKALKGLRTNAFAAVVMLLLEFGLGVGANLYVALPAADRGKALLAAFGTAATDGPVILSAHAVLGTILLITGVSAVVRAALIRQASLFLITGVSLLGIVVAWLSGARFVGTMTNSASLAMAIAGGVSILCYALVLFLVPGPPLAQGTS